MGATVPASAHPRIGVAITTVGRWGPLRQLLGDLVAQSHQPSVVAIAHHDHADAAQADALIESFSGDLEIRRVVSRRGISNGRNAAAAALGDDVDWLWFPNDTSRVEPDFLERVARHCVTTATVVAVQLVDREGPRNPLPARGSKLTRRNVWGAMEPATLVKRGDFAAVGGFNPLLGSGADSPWQSGEGPDLLLRLSALDDFSIEWVGDIVIRAQTEFAHLPPHERRRKQRSYGRGAGYVLRTWRYPLWYKAAHLAAAALMPIRKPEKFSTGEAFALLVGRAEGVFGRTFCGKDDHRAILR
ncbi:glycosyltransferase family 2 protein [Mycobacterium sp. 852014-52144_SCH5372336]|uniref:glycosyltransferase family 2 protein n=1 Tax=Mycobacterium sp. 852014-52144_SCH5372336 TaxID=1834115 RepID=UPI0007FF45CD|nr:glycosyltransferase [Mycobacterium sp. 852014-52144_SCH5372336]OBB73362.1 glycosyltransferase [Mycobacterium sp. 852014-52144_SCH5372336]